VPDSKKKPPSEIPQLFKNLWPTTVWLGGILVLTLFPGNYFPKVSGLWSLFSADKLIHLCLFAGLSFLLLSGLEKQYYRYNSRYIQVVVAGFSLGIAIITELLQWQLPIKRDGNIYDFIANFAGIVTGFLLFTFPVIKKWEK
jgi:VanZ family protein